MSASTPPEFFVTHAKRLSVKQRLEVAENRIDKIVSKLAANRLIHSEYRFRFALLPPTTTRPNVP